MKKENGKRNRERPTRRGGTWKEEPAKVKKKKTKMGMHRNKSNSHVTKFSIFYFSPIPLTIFLTYSIHQQPNK